MKTIKTNSLSTLYGNVLLFFVSFVTIVAVLEVASRIFIPEGSPIEQLYEVGNVRNPRPYTSFSGKRDAGLFNSLGYIGQVPEQIKNKDEYRVFMLGGSTTVLGEPNVPQLLEDLFVRDGRTNIKVFGFGVISSVSGMELSQIVHEVVDLDPDMIVMYNGGNDIMHPLYWDPRPGYPYNFIATERNPLMQSSFSEYPTLTLLLYGSRLLRFLIPEFFVAKLFSLTEVRNEAGYGSEKWKQEIADCYLNNIKKASIISKAHDIKFHTFLQPLLAYKNEVTLEEKPLQHFETVTHALDVRRRILIGGQATLNLDNEFVDLSGLFRNEKGHVFTDFIHVKQEAREQVAEAIYSQIRGEF
jgi:lysophospholipase L1-like esterase